MSVRADLAAIIRQHEDWDAAADEDWDAAADAVLDYLGQLDPDADPELIALHLRGSREEIARLRWALRSACSDGWTDAEAAERGYLADAAKAVASAFTVRALTEEVPRG